MGLVLEQCLYSPFGLRADRIPHVLSPLEERRAGGGAARTVCAVGCNPLGRIGIGFGQSSAFILSQGDILIDETGFITGFGAT